METDFISDPNSAEWRVEITQFLPNNVSGRKLVVEDADDKIIAYLPASGKFGGGRESKRVTLEKTLLLDCLFFEGLGLWQGEGGKGKGVYFATPILSYSATS